MSITFPTQQESTYLLLKNKTISPRSIPGADCRKAGADKRKTGNLLSKTAGLGDPYGNRTHVTAVKGRCLNRLTNGPGSGNLTRTDDTPGMNRMLYQLSYAAIFT